MSVQLSTTLTSTYCDINMDCFGTTQARVRVTFSVSILRGSAVGSGLATCTSDPPTASTLKPSSRNVGHEFEHGARKLAVVIIAADRRNTREVRLGNRKISRWHEMPLLR